jgi:uncharacterized membrane protein YfcA
MNYLILLLILLTVLAKADQSCDLDSLCDELSTCINKKCVHKGLFPLAMTEYIGTGVMLVISCIANAGGIGGSSITISLMLLLFKFDAHTAVAMTQIFIFGGTATAISLKLRDRHPTRDRPLIYYDVLMQIIGPILLGVTIGITVNPSFPDWVILASLTLLVLLLLWDIIGRVKKIHKIEHSASLVKKKKREMSSEQSPFAYLIRTFVSEASIYKEPQSLYMFRPSDSESEELSGLSYKTSEYLNKIRKPAYVQNDFHDESGDFQLRPINYSSTRLENQLNSIYQHEKKIISWIPALYFIILALINIAFSLLKGSSSSPSIIGIQSCSPGHIGLTVGYLFIMLVMIALSSYYLVKKTEICERGGYSFDEGDVRWNHRKCIIVSLFGVFTGIVVGLLGMGGGNIIGPMLLGLGVRPEVSTISSSFSIFLSSGTAAAQFFITGNIEIDYASWLLFISIIGSFIGVVVLRKYAIKYNRVSILVMCLGVILFCSLIIIPTIGIIDALNQIHKGSFQLGFSSLC